VFYSSHVKAAINIRTALRMAVIVCSLEDGSLGTKLKWCGTYHLIDKAKKKK
jgi:hypothetical protein